MNPEMTRNIEQYRTSLKESYKQMRSAMISIAKIKATADLMKEDLEFKALEDKFARYREEKRREQKALETKRAEDARLVAA